MRLQAPTVQRKGFTGRARTTGQTSGGAPLTAHPSPMTRRPLVGIVMGSDSDLPVMEEAAKVLQRFGVPFELKICSAHRSLHATLEYVRKAEPRGIRVIIAGAGGAAHPGGGIAGPH